MIFKKIDGQKLKSYREARNLTQAALADQAGISAQIVSNIECGRAGAIGQRYDTISLLASALGISIDELTSVDITINDNHEKDSLAKIVQNSFASHSPEAFVAKEIRDNDKWIDDLISKFEEKNNATYAYMVDDLLFKKNSSLTTLCNKIANQLYVLYVHHPELFTSDVSMYAKLVIYDMGSVLNRQASQIHLTNHLDREMFITFIIQCSRIMLENDKIDRDRLHLITDSIKNGRFNNNYDRAKDLINLYFYVCEEWELLKNSRNSYELLQHIACILEDPAVEPDDHITRICMARVTHRTILFWEEIEKQCRANE